MAACSPSVIPSTGHMRAEWTLDPTFIRVAVDAAIVHNPQEAEGRPKGLPSPIVDLVVSYLEVFSGRASIFGKNEWDTLCGRVALAPSLPSDIEQIWQSPCPVFPGKRICETHVLVYLPLLVDKKPLTLNSFGEIAKRYFPKNEAGYTKFYCGKLDADALGDRPNERSSWVLMTKDVIPGSRKKSYAEQQTLVTDLAAKAFAPYEVPMTLEASVCILTQYFSSYNNSQTRLFDWDPGIMSWTYTHCQDFLNAGYKMVVGRFVSDGLEVCIGYLDCYDEEQIGVAALRKLPRRE